MNRFLILIVALLALALPVLLGSTAAAKIVTMATLLAVAALSLVYLPRARPRERRKSCGRRRVRGPPALFRKLCFALSLVSALTSILAPVVVAAQQQQQTLPRELSNPAELFLPGVGRGARQAASRGHNLTALSNGTDTGQNSIQVVTLSEAVINPILVYSNSFVSTDKDTPGTNPIDVTCSIEYPVNSGTIYTGLSLSDRRAKYTIDPGGMGAFCIWGFSAPKGAQIGIRTNVDVFAYGLGAKFPVGNKATSGVVGGLGDKSTNYITQSATVTASAASGATSLTISALPQTITGATVMNLYSGANTNPLTITTSGTNTAGATTLTVSAISGPITANTIYVVPAGLTQTLSASGGLSNSLAAMYAPHVVLNGTRSLARSVYILGDSNARGEAETLTPSSNGGPVYCYYDLGGPYYRACTSDSTKPIGCIFGGKNSARADLVRAGLMARLQFVPFVTDVILHLGTNDWITGGRSAVQIQADLVAIAQMCKFLNPSVRVWVSAVPPSTTSASLAGRTLADQTVKTGETTVRQPLNAALALVPAPFDGFIDIATPFQDAATGKFLPPTDIRTSQSVASGTTTTATIMGANYVTDELVGYTAQIQGDTNANLRIIRSNTSNTITIDGTWAAGAPTMGVLIDIFNGLWGKDGLHPSPIWIKAAAAIVKATLGL